MRIFINSVRPHFLTALQTVAAVTAATIIPPPAMALTAGVSPRARKTHNGLNTGSMTAMRFADTADTLLIATENSIDDNPIWMIPRIANTAVSALGVMHGAA